MKSKIITLFTLCMFLISGYSFSQDLINAVKSGDINAVRELLPYSNMEEKDDDAYTAYHWTAILGRTDIADLLLEYGANPNALTTFARTNIKGGYSETQESLQESMTSKDAVILAAENNNNDENLVDYYISKGRMESHFLAAVRCGNIFVTEFALAKGADVNTEISFLQTVVYDAADAALNYGGKEEIVDILIENGADLSKELDTAIVKGIGNERMWQYLMNKGAELRPLLENDNTDDTSLLLYQKNARGHLKFFIDNGIDLTVQDEESGRTILHWAVDKNWKLAEIKQLIPRNCNKECLMPYLETKDDEGQTACDIVKEKLEYKEGYGKQFIEYLTKVRQIVCSDYITKAIINSLNK